nr:hypothetical protein [Nostoc piscinale]
MWTHGLGYRITNADPQGRYTIIKEVISDPHLSCILQHTKIQGERELISQLDLYALCAPHLEVGGKGNNGYIVEVSGQQILVAEKKRNLAGARCNNSIHVPFLRLCGSK